MHTKKIQYTVVKPDVYSPARGNQANIPRLPADQPNSQAAKLAQPSGPLSSETSTPMSPFVLCCCPSVLSPHIT